MTVVSSLADNRVPFISVIIPAHNSAAWIEETLASVAQQTIGPDKVEVIVVDDGSTDKTADLAERFLSQTELRWSVIRQVNSGPGHARNVGMKMAHGTWLQFLDADDLIEPEKFAIQWNVAQHCTDDTAVIYSPWRKFGLIDTRWEHGETISPRVKRDLVAELFSEELSIATGSQLYSRAWLEEVGGW